MARKNPLIDEQQPGSALTPLYFTGREDAIADFRGFTTCPHLELMKILMFYGVGGVGKTSLMRKLGEDLDAADPPLPHAYFNLERVNSRAQAYREVLQRLRSDLKMNFNIPFPRFDLCLEVLLAREGGTPPPLFDFNQERRDVIEAVLLLAPTYVTVPLKLIQKPLHDAIRKSEPLARWMQRIGGMDKVVALTAQMMGEDENLPREMVKRFAEDLAENLPLRHSAVCRGVIFLDTYETLWIGGDGGVAEQSRRLDEWVRDLAEYCLGSGVLLVISGRDPLMWAKDHCDRWKREEIAIRPLGGLNAQEAQTYLSKRDIPPSPESGELSAQQRSIVACCNTAPSPEDKVECHSLYLALCADIVQSTRRETGLEPAQDTFSGIPTQGVASELASRFLKSLPEKMDLWVKALSLTPRFDTEAALALNKDGGYDVGRSGWEHLKRFSFMTPQPNGFFRMHKTMRGVLQTHLGEEDAERLHEWYAKYWAGRNEPSLAFYHRWMVDPETANKELYGSNQVAWLDVLELERDNLLAVLHLYLEDGNGVPKAMRLVAALQPFWWIRGFVIEGQQWTDAVLSQQAARDKTKARADVLNGAGVLASWQGDNRRARTLYEESLQIYKALHDEYGIILALQNLVDVASRQGDSATVLILSKDALRASRRLLRRATETAGTTDLTRLHAVKAGILLELGNVAIRQGKGEKARIYFEKSLTIRRSVEDKRGVATSACNLGRLACGRGDYEQAWIYHKEGLLLRHQLKDRYGVAASLEGIAAVAKALIQRQRSVILFAGARRLRDELGIPLTTVEDKRIDGDLQQMRDDLGSEAFAREWATGYALSLDQAVASVLENTMV